MGRGDLAAPLNQRAIGVEQKPGVVNGSAITLVDAKGHNNSRLFASFTNGVGRRGRNRHGLLQQI